MDWGTGALGNCLTELGCVDGLAEAALGEGEPGGHLVALPNDRRVIRLGQVRLGDWGTSWRAEREYVGWVWRGV
ncbi:hypothetical protein GCM10010522_40830 [Kribbella solani]